VKGHFIFHINYADLYFPKANKLNAQTANRPRKYQWPSFEIIFFLSLAFSITSLLIHETANFFTVSESSLGGAYFKTIVLECTTIAFSLRKQSKQFIGNSIGRVWHESMISQLTN
jgi:hypothetical protein